MEVHHHPNVEKKSFKEYVLEGLMIFLAVTMGFFAEGIREHMTEKKKEKELIGALQKDLQKDTTDLHFVINTYMPTLNRWLDSFNAEIKTPLKGNEKKVYLSYANATFWYNYESKDLAFSLVKSNGLFNLVESKELKKELIEYSDLINAFTNYKAIIYAAEHGLDTFSLNFFQLKDYKLLGNNVQGDSYTKINSRGGAFVLDDIPGEINFKTYTVNDFLSLSKKMEQVNMLMNDISTFHKAIYKKETELLKLIEKEYGPGH